ncbi:unnamed protein product [Prorocentrum cordatum]|uniref:Uncharacterized protein n=1 Tax=Prorocentrum cordatum TaxID=2364126 RepID=A0ABN9UM48_9DINO|nr:unnamed protein product [Polarella glacialis]
MDCRMCFPRSAMEAEGVHFGRLRPYHLEHGEATLEREVTEVIGGSVVVTISSTHHLRQTPDVESDLQPDAESDCVADAKPHRFPDVRGWRLSGLVVSTSTLRM